MISFHVCTYVAWYDLRLHELSYRWFSCNQKMCGPSALEVTRGCSWSIDDPCHFEQLTCTLQFYDCIRCGAAHVHLAILRCTRATAGERCWVGCCQRLVRQQLMKPSCHWPNLCDAALALRQLLVTFGIWSQCNLLRSDESSALNWCNFSGGTHVASWRKFVTFSLVRNPDVTCMSLSRPSVVIDEVSTYFQTKDQCNAKFDIVDWWRVNTAFFCVCPQWPNIQAYCHASSSATERSFCAADGRRFSVQRHWRCTETVDSILFVRF